MRIPIVVLCLVQVYFTCCCCCCCCCCVVSLLLITLQTHKFMHARIYVYRLPTRFEKEDEPHFVIQSSHRYIPISFCIYIVVAVINNSESDESGESRNGFISLFTHSLISNSQIKIFKKKKLQSKNNVWYHHRSTQSRTKSMAQRSSD